MEILFNQKPFGHLPALLSHLCTRLQLKDSIKTYDEPVQFSGTESDFYNSFLIYFIPGSVFTPLLLCFCMLSFISESSYRLAIILNKINNIFIVIVDQFPVNVPKRLEGARESIYNKAGFSYGWIYLALQLLLIDDLTLCSRSHKAAGSGISSTKGEGRQKVSWLMYFFTYEGLWRRAVKYCTAHINPFHQLTC